MGEEEEDRVLLSILGITSANPEDIERDVLEQAKNDRTDVGEAGGRTEEGLLERTKSHITSSSSHGNVYNQLRAIEVEIDAVKSSLELGRFSGHENDGKEVENAEDEDTDFLGSPNDLSLQHALAVDRLKSLRKRKAQLEKEIPGTENDGRQDKLIRKIVSEDINSKKKPKGLAKKSKDQKRPSKGVSFREDDDFDAVLNAASAGLMETERDELVRKGVLTPFHKLKGYERRIQDPSSSSRSIVLENVDKNDDFASSSIAKAARSISEAANARPTTILLDPKALPKQDAPTRPFQRLKAPLKIPSSVDDDAQRNNGLKRKKKRPLPARKRRKSSYKDKTIDENGEESSCHDEDYLEDVAGVENEDNEEPAFVTLEGGLRIPEAIFDQLFDYQKVGVQWLWELHCQRAGGIIGDEMGLGKTIQMVAFLGSLHFSNMYKPSIIVCPVTLLRQWKREVLKWYPAFHVEILHDSAQNASDRKKGVKHNSSDDESEFTSDMEVEKNSSSKSTNKWESVLNRVLSTESGMLITTYEQLRLQGDILLDIDWGYAVLDEGHRIRNPNAEVTLVCKQLQTVHRIIMTGAPIQNKLTELWSLFDFVFPGKLGVLPVFEAEFAVPISVGGYANASPLQVSTAYRCAVVLRDLIMPYLLRRMKADVNAQLPKKAEHVLFCSLTAEQRAVYRAFLASSDVEQIFDGNRNSLYGIDIMRKICNHPDLLEREHASKNPDYGNPERSGKLKVVAQVLKVWKEQGHRVLLFAQTQQMLDILEKFLIADDYSYRRMDGLTPVKHRMNLIDEFNNSEDIFIFILTTKVGGLGTNLTGGNRVIIFDPDWNPSTDMQARERAWRIGQTKDVTVFRLITRGTIEEKVYHRQIYKHFLTNKILKNPQQRRFFKARDMKDLFTLTDDVEGSSTETSNIFGQLSENVNVLGAHDNNGNKPRSPQIEAAGADDSGNSKPDDSEGGEKSTSLSSLSERKVDEETSILQSLFDAQGIHSAMNHDAIMNAHNEDTTKIEEQASQVAQRAAEALRQSRMLRRREDVAIPTWTGKSGAAGAPSSVKKKFGSTVRNSRSSEELNKGSDTRPSGFIAGASSGRALSSAELLAKIRGNQESAASQGLEQQHLSLASSSSNGGRVRSVVNGRSNSSSNANVHPEMLIRQLCTFIQQKGGRAGSAGIVDHFQDKIPSKDLPLFKNLLKEIAVLEKSSSGSLWVLKPDYQQQ